MTAHRRDGDTSSGIVDPVEVAAAAILEQELVPAPNARRGRFFSARTRRGHEPREVEQAVVDLEDWRPATELREAAGDPEPVGTAATELIDELEALAPELASRDVRSHEAPADGTSVDGTSGDGVVDARVHVVLQAGQAVEDRARHVVDALQQVMARVGDLDSLTADARVLTEEAATTSRASLNVLAATEALALETQDALERRTVAEAGAHAAEQVRRDAEERLAAALDEQQTLMARLASTQEELVRAQRERAADEEAAAGIVQDLRAALTSAADTAAQAHDRRRDADRELAAHKVDLATAQAQLTQALNENELLAQDLTQALRSATAAADEARDAQGRRLQAELAVTVTASAAREAQERAAAAAESGIRLQQQLEEQAAQLRALLGASATHLQEARAEREAHQQALAEARDQVLVQAQERIRAETCVAELLRTARPGRRFGLVPRLAFAPSSVAAGSPGSVAQAAPPTEEPAPPTVADRLTVQKGSPRVLVTVVGVLLALVAVLSFVTGASLVVTGVAAGLAALAVLLGQRISRPAAVEIVGSVMHVRQNASHHVFDLADPGLRIETEGTADGRGWQVLFHRRGLSPVVLSRRDVDPEQFTAQLERWRGDAVS